MKSTNSQKQKESGGKRNNGNTIQPENNNMALISPYISIITLNINRLNSSVTRYRVAGWIKKQDSTIYCLQKTHFSSMDNLTLK
jgi:hypothetical protein